MLVIVSDLHLTDGTTGLRIPVGAFRVFRERLESMAYDASKRDENTYKPIEAFDLVLLGDILDLLRSTRWNDENKGQAGYARPWSDHNSPAFVNKVEQIVEGIFQQNAKTFDILRSLADGTGISLPPATKTGGVDRRVSRDRRSASRLPVRVNIHYMNGNHDWIFHLPGANFDRIRRRVIDQMGLKNSAGPFPHAADESPTIQSTFDQHAVFARHGDIYDPFNFVKEHGRDYSSLGDALVVELFNTFPRAIEEEFKEQLPHKFYDDLCEMGSIRPGTMTPVWIATLLERHQIDERQRAKIDELWKYQVDQFLKLDFLKELDKPFLDLVDSVEALLKILSTISLERLDKLAPVAERIIKLHAAIAGGGEFGFDKNASREEAYQSREARFIVYGHTHGFKLLPLRSTVLNGSLFDQMYLNSGTWHPLHELGVDDPRKRGFILHKTMSYLGFYRGDERKGRAFETWTGALDL
ncbi:MAG: hypothetical protein P8074_11400 [Anaerolineales bacterium]